ncbi:hypothetical protein AAF712_014737 [Marasmius tenuissimus]|uniref:Protein kinase domain-containing protein n=1 Tax=Marasmius tenuissimus TaxID=585030 RepID=A0ABR2ZCB3_9AGAR
MENEKGSSSSFSWWGRSDDDGKGAERDAKRRAEMVSALRPWSDGSPGPPQKKPGVPQEQTEGWIATRQRVAQAARSVLGTAVDVTHEALVLSTDLLEFAPIPGLSACARTLLMIWDSLQMVDLNRLQCLRLTERCAEILLSVRQEVHEAGDQVTEELKLPIAKLTESFNTVYLFLQKQAHRPFLKRYLKRDEILKQIQGCDTELQEALGMFSLSIQIRILKQVQASESRRQQESKMILDEVVQDRKEREEDRMLREADRREREADREERLRLGGLSPPLSPPSYPSSASTITLGQTSNGTITPGNPETSTITGVQPPAGPSTYPAGPLYTTYPLSPTISGQSTSKSSVVTATGPSTPTPAPVPPSSNQPPPLKIPSISPPHQVLSPVPTSPSSLLKALETIRVHQNLSDAALDAQDLRNLMREALATGSDVEMLQVLGVGREEMPEAIKTMQRALEVVVERESREDEETRRLREFQTEMVGGFQQKNGDAGIAKPARPPVSRSSSARSGIPTVHEDGPAMTTSSDLGNGKGGMKGKKSGVGMRRSKTTSTRMSKSSSSSDSGISGVSAGGSGGSGGSQPKDTLDREFIESGIDALRRMSRGVDKELSLPSWTITRYEVDREKKIGIGFFSDVYRGTWRHRTVAIKVLAETTPRNLFLREIGIWKQLQHPNVLELNGASSASGDPPWFFVSPYMQNGSLSEFLRRIMSLAGRLASLPSAAAMPESGSRSRTSSYPGWTVTPPSGNTSKHRPESFSGPSPGGAPSSDALGLGLIGLPVPMTPSSSQHGHRRGRSGSGSGSVIAMASAATLGEVEKEWDLLKFMHEIAKGMEYLHSNGVLHGDLKSEMKSEAYRISGTPAPHGTLRWQAPELMGGLSQLTVEMDVYAFAITCIEVLSMGRMPWPLQDDDTVRHFVLRDDTRPIIPQTRFSTPAVQEIVRSCWSTNPFDRPTFSEVARDLKKLRKNGAPEEVTSPRMPESGTLNMGLHRGRVRICGLYLCLQRLLILIVSGAKMDPLVLYLTVSMTVMIRRPPTDTRLAEARDERRYRMLLVHDFHPSVSYSLYSYFNLELIHLCDIVTLPLWAPSAVAIGAVGYLQKPEGKFVTLFNAFSPEKTKDVQKGIPSVFGYGKVATGNQRSDKRNAAQRGLDALAGFLTFRNGLLPQGLVRRYSYPLRAGHKAAYLCTESTVYRYVESLDAPKKWFKANVDTILEIFGAKHHIQKEDLYFVIGTLDAPDYGLFVSHSHPDGQTQLFPPKVGGPNYDEPVSAKQVNKSKVSNAPGSSWETVLVARLRFKPDVLEPTSL